MAGLAHGGLSCAVCCRFRIDESLGCFAALLAATHVPAPPPPPRPQPARRLKRAAPGGPLLVAASPNDLLKLSEKLGPCLAPFDLLVIDEASMMHFGHALALASRLLAPGGRLVLAGDHRQLAAISKFDFESDLRPAAVLHGAGASAYDYVRSLAAAGAARTVVSRLSSSWRFGAFEELRALISNVYRRDGLTLEAAGAELAADRMARAEARPVGTACVGGALAGVLGGAAAAALGAAACQAVPGLLGGAGGAAAGFLPLGARAYGVVAVGAMSLEPEPIADEGSDTEGGGGRVASGVGAKTLARPAATARAALGGAGDDVWRRVWGAGGRLVLVVHDESSSVKHNALEVELVSRIMQVCTRACRGAL